MRSQTRLILLAAATALAAILAVVVILTGSPTHSSSSTATTGAAAASGSGFDGAALPPGVRARAFTLTPLSSPPSGRPGGAPVSLAASRGQVVVLAFLYSTCGPTCTLIAQQIRGALDELAHPPTVLIVSADPAADTRARVSALLAQTSLTGRVHYLTGSPAQLRAVWHAYGVTPASAGRAAFDTYAQVLLIDQAGYERAIFGMEQLTAEGLAHDIRRLQSTRLHATRLIP